MLVRQATYNHALSWALVGVSSTGLGLIGTPAFAQSHRVSAAGSTRRAEGPDAPATDTSTTDTPQAAPAASLALPVASTTPATGPFARFDALAMKGWERPLPKSADTLIADKAGVRDALADVGIGFVGFASNAFQYNFLQNDRNYKGPQQYNGQRLTRSVSNAAIFATYDLGRVGLKGGQLLVSALYTSNSFNAVDGPNAVRIGRLSYYQPLFNKAVEIKVGYFDNGFEFLGTTTGGSLAGGTLGPQATVPYEVGLSYSGFSTPAINVRLNLKHNLYTKFGLQRSLPQGGAAAEVAVNPSGLAFHPKGAGLLAIDEIGFDRPAAVGTMATWVRGGAIYNSTNYKRFDGGLASHNWAAYLAVDRQVSQIDGAKPARGLYIGGTFDYAPPAQNFTSQYYEGRVYGVGLIDKRPFDLVSLLATRNVYSPAGLLARTPVGQSNYKATTAVIASYAYRVMPGLYLQPGLGIVVHPIFTPHYGTALNGYLTLTAFL